MDTNELEKKSIPRDQFKKIHTEDKMISNTQYSMTNNTENTIEIQDSDIQMHMINYTKHNMNKVEDGDIDMDTNDNMIENMKSNTIVITNNTVFSLDEEDSFLPDRNIIQHTPVRQTSSQNITCHMDITNVMPGKKYIQTP